MKIFTYNILLLVACMLQTAVAQMAQYGPKGIWTSPGKTLPLNEVWQIERRVSGTADWTVLGQIRRANSVEEINARLMDLVSTGVEVDFPNESELQVIWRKSSGLENMDSLQNYFTNYPMMYAMGLTYLDVNVPKGKYDYRWSVARNADIPSKAINNIATTPVAVGAVLISESAEAVSNGIHVEYAIEKVGNMQRVKVFRSYYQRTEYQEIKVNALFYKKEGQYYVSFNDESASPKVPYSYYLLPIDAAGNAGEKSPEVAMYNVRENSIPPSVSHLNTTSKTDEKAIELTWKLNNPKDVVSIDIFKSLVYDGRYFKIASVKPSDTAYLDYNVTPIVTYYYTVVLNGAYEVSPNSPRISGLLQASEGNYLPIQELELVQKNNIVTLKWLRTEDDTRGYYIYRGTGYTGELFQYKDILLSDSGMVEFTDTLPNDFYPQVYAYAVADVNTSYNIGPKSQRVFAYSLGSQSLPMIDSLNLQYDGRRVLLVWANQTELGLAVESYSVMRAVENEKGEVTDFVEVANLPVETNSFEDLDIKAGSKYRYQVYNVSADGQRSNGSPEVILNTMVESLSPVSELTAYTADGQVVLNFTPPMDSAVSEIRIYRGENGAEAKLYITLSVTATQFVDKEVSKGKQYYYFVFTAAADGRESRILEPVGVYVK